MKPKKELNFIIQGNYGQGWEDVSSYPCGFRRVNFRAAWETCKQDFKEYCLMGYAHRIIKRYEPLMED